MGWFRQDRPIARLLSQTAGVHSYQLNWQRGTLEIRVLLTAGVDLPDFYPRLKHQIAAILGDRPFQVVVEDRRDGSLREAYREMRLYLEEAVVTGRYVWADEHVRRLASEKGLTWARFAVDDDHLYLELRDSGSYLYAVMPRHRP